VTYRTLFTATARRELRAVELPIARRILAKLTELESDPFGFGTTALVGEPSVRRLRVGDWRVMYRVEQDELIVMVIRIRHRSLAYDQAPNGRP